jgi:hypothetical protein
VPDVVAADAGASTANVVAADSRVADAAVGDSAGAIDSTLHDGAGDVEAVPDASVDAADACGPPLGATSPLTAKKAPGTITIDGNLREWPCESFVTLSVSRGIVSVGDASTVPLSGEFAVLWDAQHLYVAAHMVDPNVATTPGTNTTTPWENISVATYVSGDTSPNGDYTGLDDQFVVDSKNLAVDYKDGVATSSHPDFTSAVSVDGGSWSVEVSMSVAAVGLGQVAANQHIGFDLDFVDGDGTKQNYQLIWYLAAHSTCSCASCCCNSSPSVDLPYCDVLRFGALDLSP